MQGACCARWADGLTEEFVGDEDLREQHSVQKHSTLCLPPCRITR